MILDWFAQNGLRINQGKTECLLLQNPKGHQMPVSPNLLLGTLPLATVEKQRVRMLGIWLDTKLTFSEHVNVVAQKLTRINWILFKLKMLNVPRFVLLRCYKALLLPYLVFGAPCWGFAAKAHIQRLVVLQNNAVRTIFD